MIVFTLVAGAVVFAVVVGLLVAGMVHQVKADARKIEARRRDAASAATSRIVAAQAPEAAAVAA